MSAVCMKSGESSSKTGVLLSAYFRSIETALTLFTASSFGGKRLVHAKRVLCAITSGLALLFLATAQPTLSHADEKKAFVPAKPTEKTQTQKTVEERGGVNPCNTKEPSPGIYQGWNRGPSIGQMVMPGRGGVTKDGKFDVVFHFHGHDPMRREWVQVADGAVLVGITLGIGSGVYEQTFADPKVFKELVASVEAEVAKVRGIKSAKVRKVGLSAWSAGYGAVKSILRSDYGKDLADSVILLDGLHASYNPDGTLDELSLGPFMAYAKRAKAGKRFMYVSHSSIIPPDYASTTETVNFLIHELGGRPKAQKPRKGDPMGLELNSKFDVGNFHARGFDGNDKMDHCAHIGLMRDVVKSFLKKRWNGPKGQALKKVEPGKKNAEPTKSAAIAPAASSVSSKKKKTAAKAKTKKK